MKVKVIEVVGGEWGDLRCEVLDNSNAYNNLYGSYICVDFHVDGKIKENREALIGRTFEIRPVPHTVIAMDIEELK